MAMLGFNQRQIEAFRAVMLTDTMTGAAELLHVTQPAISRLIADFERASGLRLLDRRGAHISPTPEALALYSEVERYFSGLDRIERAASEIRNLRTGALRIAAMVAPAVSFLPRFLAAFLSTRPGLRAALHADNSRTVLELVARQQFDLGIAAVPGEFPGLDVEPLPPLSAVCISPREHRFGTRAVIDIQDLKGEKFIALGQSSLLRNRIDSALRAHAIEHSVVLETPLSVTAWNLVAQGLGVALIDPFTAADGTGTDVVRHGFHPDIPFKLSLVFPAKRARGRVVEEFAEGIRAAVPASWCPIQPQAGTAAASEANRETRNGARS